MQALREFATAADSADWAVVYYSGHGMEFNGVNYIIPVDARLKVDRDVDLEAVDAGKILSAIEGSKRLRLVILDACRDNPFASQMKRTVETKSLGRGLARMEPEAGTLIVYAAKHGESALDGTGRNSPFVEALTHRIQERPTQEIRRLFDLVRDDVMELTRRSSSPSHTVRCQAGTFLLLEIVLAADRPRHQSLKLPRNHRSSKLKSKFMQGSCGSLCLFCTSAAGKFARGSSTVSCKTTRRHKSDCVQAVRGSLQGTSPGRQSVSREPF